MTETEMLMHWYQQKNKYPPCYDRTTREHCQERFVGCHATCKEYLEYRANQDKRLEEQHKKSQQSEALEENYRRCQKIHDRRRGKHGY